MSKSKASRQADATAQMKALPAFHRGAVEFAAGAEDFGAIADRLGRIAALKAELAAYEEKLKDVLIELGEDAVEGKLFRATLSVYDHVRLDSAKIREAMDEKWLDKYSTTQKVKQIRVKARTGALADAA